MKNKITPTLIACILLFSLVSLAALAQSTEPPALPSFFYGTAMVNGRNVPVNSLIIAKIDGEVRGKITVKEAGKYGEKDIDYKLGVTGTASDRGKQISFSLKMPGIEEMKSTDTAAWRSGEISQIDLTFFGQEVAEQEPQIVGGENGGSGTGGGGSSSGGPTLNSNKKSNAVILLEIKQGLQRDIYFAKPNTPVTTLQMILDVTLKNIELTIEELADVEPSMENVYKYLSIEAPKIADKDIQTIIIKFRIPNEWFAETNYDPGKVSLWRYADQWTELETVHEGSDAFYNYYRASTPGFSYFAIASGKLENSAEFSPQETAEDKGGDITVVQSSTDVPDDASSDTTQQQTSPDETTNQITAMATADQGPGRFNIWLIAALLGGLIVLVVLYFIATD